MYFLSVILLPQWPRSPSSQYRTRAVQIWCKLQWLSWSFPPLHFFRGKHHSREEKALLNSSFLQCPKHLDLPSLEEVAKKPWLPFSSTAWTQSVAMFLATSFLGLNLCVAFFLTLPCPASALISFFSLCCL